MSSLVLILLLAAAATACVSALIFALQRQRTHRKSDARRAPSSSSARARPKPAATPGTTHQLSAAERDEMLDGVKNLAENDPEKVAGLIRSWISEDEPPRR